MAPETFSTQVKALIRAGQRAQALRLLSEAIRADTRNAEAWWLLSFAIEDRQKQLEALRRVLQLRPGNLAAERRLAELDPHAAIESLRRQATQPAKPAARSVLSYKQPEKAQVIATPKARAWTFGLAALFVVTIGTAVILNSALSANAAPQAQAEKPQSAEDAAAIAELAAAPDTLPDIVVVLPSETLQSQNEPIAEPTALPTLAPTSLIPDSGLTPTPTPEPTSDLPALDKFVASVANGDSGSRVGVFVEDLFSFPIVQQPSSDPAWITSNFGEVTEFRIVRQQTGNEGLIAHNYLAGGQFYSLKVGDIAELVLGDGSVLEFVIYDIQDYQALSPNSPTSDFLSLASGEKLSASDLFYRVYGGNMTITFQTCINRDNVSTWGRTFIIGEEL